MREASTEKLIAHVTGTHLENGRQYNSGVVLVWTGETMTVERDFCGVHLDDWNPLPVCNEAGLMVFEGINLRNQEDTEPYWRGSWRRPSAVELLQLCCPTISTPLE